MLDKIIHFSIKNKIVIGLFTIALIILGSYSLTQLPIDAVPDITNKQVQVITSSPSLAAGEIERLVTFPVEQTMATIPGIEEVRSFSRFGLSVVTIVFKDNVDVYWARQQVNERLTEAKTIIPDGVGSVSYTHLDVYKRQQLERMDIPITKRMRFGFMLNTDKEYMIDLKYILNKNMGIRTHYDSDMGFGVGLSLNY